MAPHSAAVEQVLNLLPVGGGEVAYQEFQKQVSAAQIDGGTEALRYIVRKNLIGKRITSDKFNDPVSGKQIYVVMVKRLS